MHYSERLRRLAIDDGLPDEDGWPVGSRRLDDRTRSLVRIGAMVAVLAPASTLRKEIDDATGAGADEEEIVEVLDAVMCVVGRPRAVAAALKLARALGVDLDLLDGQL